MTGDTPREVIASLRRYLEEVRETGVEGLPLAAPAPSVSVVEASSAPAASGEARETLDDIRREMGGCHRCALGAGRTNLVFGVGNPAARLMIIGEAPGRDEDFRGEPFVGEAGQLLTKIIEAMGFAREDVYICNVLKCRPPHNRDPASAEIEACSSFMLRQVMAVAPEAILALGTFAAQAILSTKEPISRLRGRFHDYHGIPLMPTFHPAFLLRNPERKRDVWDDVRQVMGLLGKEAPGKGDRR
ncbi:uracil-DNA glycosylase [Geobacter sulfurreducens subsp. ethanolicus]|uniref:uracil-DNA glycosylase n=1 Tax=Geobacter sulfurreducens TaxID=35554 RepID=UPI0025745598|nr:uracil-DNA glycosylase [Geobacter sulfurreducens]BEH10880.1 uracil-DNA glycosylase [Geobacter sulfurreducens subsp. ethanolicus]